jgi:hypothetical protein
MGPDPKDKQKAIDEQQKKIRKETQEELLT